MSLIPESITSPPPKAELASRLQRLRSKMSQLGLDYCVIFDPVNLYYLTHFANAVHERPFILVVPACGTPKLVAPLLEVSHVQMRALCELDLATYYDYPAPKGQTWQDAFAPLIPNGARVGIESALPIGLANVTPGNKGIHDLVDEMRLVKTDYEIGRNVHACHVVSVGHKTLLDVCRPGVLEGRIVERVSQRIMQEILRDIPRANPVVTSPLVAVWPPSASHMPHIYPDYTLPMQHGGPHISASCAQVDGYGVEVERTFFLGDVPDDARAPFDCMLQARNLAFELTRPGAVLSDIDHAVRELIARHGYGDRIQHRTGHGLGITGHEAPFIALGDERELEPNMLVSIEPGIYIPGIGGFRHSDTVLVTQEGCVSLTCAPDTLEELTIPL